MTIWIQNVQHDKSYKYKQKGSTIDLDIKCYTYPIHIYISDIRMLERENEIKCMNVV